jgi:hypothetical protein
MKKKIKFQYYAYFQVHGNEDMTFNNFGDFSLCVIVCICYWVFVRLSREQNSLLDSDLLWFQRQKFFNCENSVRTFLENFMFLLQQIMK